MNRSLTHATVSLPLPRVTSPANGRGEVRRWVAVCLSFFLVVAPATADELSIYEVGISKVDISPDYPIRLNGFGNRRKESEGISQRIHARALAISAGEAKPMVLIAIDSLGVRIGMVDEVAARLQTSHGIPRENIALTFTHSHCTPKVNGASDNIFSTPIPAAHQEHIDVYTRELTDHIAEAARLAINNRQASRLEWASGKVRFSKNRRTPGGPVDHDLPTLFVRDAKSDQIRAVYVAYACHAVTLSFNQISGDWPGHAVESIERDIPGATALVSIGAGSDSNPIPGVQGDKVEIAKSQGAEIGAEVQRLLQTPRRPVTGTPLATLNRIDLPLNTLPTRDQLEELAKTGRQVGHNAITQLARLDRGEPLLAAIDYPIQTWSFGDSLSVVFLAGEVCVDYSSRLKTELDHERFWLNAYSNDFCSYIPSERLAREGGYGGGSETPYFALPTTLASGLEQRIVDEVHRQVPDSFNVPPGTQGVAPKSPEASLRCLQTHDNLRIELVAAEPLIQDPVAIDFGADGRLWVAEMNDYGHGVYESFQQNGRIRWLRDTNNDGHFDEARTFVDGLRFPTDVKVWRDGVLICDAPDILFARDENGDGIADSTKNLFSGFDVRNAQARVNSLRFGLDNWMYGSCGLFGGKIISHLTGETVDVTSRDFRLDPDTGVIEPATGRTQQGRCRNDWGDWFGCSNGTLIMHYPTKDRYARRSPYAVPAPPTVDAANAEALRLYPPKELVRFELSGAPGKATSACGLGIYRDSRLGPKYAGNAFTCEPVHQLVHRIVLEPSGLKFSGRRAANEAQTEFLSSTDRWFRPVQMRTGPDGAIWIVDMYRYVIEHSRWIPQATLAQLDVYAGRGRGRIYRILPRDVNADGSLPAAPGLPTLEELSDEEVVQQLNQPNGTIRDLAQQLLIWRDAKSVAGDLMKLANSSEFPQSRIHALATLEALGQLNADVVRGALRSDHPEVVRHAVRLAEPLMNNTPELIEAVIGQIAHPSARVRRQVAWSLGAGQSPKAARALAALLDSDRADIYIRAAVLSSITAENASATLDAFQQLRRNSQTGSQEQPRDLRDLLSVAIGMGDASSIPAIIESVAPTTNDSETENVALDASITLLVAALDTADARSLSKLTFSADFCNWVQASHATAAKIVASSDAAASQIQLALAILGRRRGSVTEQLLGGATENAPVKITEDEVAVGVASLISARHSTEIQQAAVMALSRTGRPQVADLLVTRFPSASAGTRQAMLDALLSRDDWTRRLLDHIASGRVRQTSFDASRQQRLLAHGHADIRAKATELFQSAGTPSQAELLTSYDPALGMTGDLTRGRTVFRKTCSPCHQIADHGHVVGPNLMALTNHDPKWLLTTILDPNREVDARYIAWTALRKDGRTATGLLVEETSTAIRLRESGGKEHLILRHDLEEIRSSELSVMPEGLEKEVSLQDMADVIAYVFGFRSPPKQLTGNQPKVVALDANGALCLTAKHAEIRGDDIVFEAPFQNIGYWHSHADRASWHVTLAKVGRFDMYVDAACAHESEGNRFRIDGLPTKLSAAVMGTGGWDRYRQYKVGTVELDKGQYVITVRSDGPLTKQALFDLREVRFVPAGESTQFTATTVGDLPLPRRPPEIAPFLLDGAQSVERRSQVIDQRPGMGPAIITRLVADLRPDDQPETYRRMPWIWRVALAVAKRNDGGEIRDLLDISLPHADQPLLDWQAVVVGGGIINGLTQIGNWPDTRIAEILAGTPSIARRWPRALNLAAAMADDETVRMGTRYDALRMIAMAGWDQRGSHLVNYLTEGLPNQLQMGAVSGLSDIQSDQIIEPLIQAIARLSPRNRQLAVEALMRTETRALALLKAVESSRLASEPSELKSLLDHPSKTVRIRASHLLN